MIRILGLSKEVFENILHYNSHICRSYNENSNIIEFIPSVEIAIYADHIELSCSDNFINIMRCDFYRIEIE